MFVQTRLPGEALVIDTPAGAVVVKFVERRAKGHILIGVDAPAEYAIHRAESFTAATGRPLPAAALPKPSDLKGNR